MAPASRESARLLVGRYRRDDARTAHLRDLREQQAGAAGSCVHEARVAGLQRIRRGGEVVRGHALEHDGRTLFRGHAGWQRDEPVHGHGDRFRIAAEDAGPGHLIAGFDGGYTRAHGRDGAGALLPEAARQRDLVRAGALVGVDEVDAGRIDLDDRFARLREGIGYVFVLENLGAAECMHTNRFHSCSSTERWPRCRGRTSAKISQIRPRRYPAPGIHCRASQPEWRGSDRSPQPIPTTTDIYADNDRTAEPHVHQHRAGARGR